VSSDPGARPVGVVGLGTMGAALARHLLAAGYDVVGYDVRPEAALELEPAGLRRAADVAELARQVPVLLTSLPSVGALEAVVEALAGSKVGGIDLVEASTLPLPAKEAARARLASCRISVLDCPISGTGAQMARRDAVVYASGDADALERCRPYLEAAFRTVYLVGGFGDGSRLKFVANLLVAVHNVVAGEAIALARLSGLDPAAVLGALADGAGSSRMLEVRGPMMVERRYQPATMRVDLFKKDLLIIGEFARSLGASTPTFDACLEVYEEALRRSLGAEDTASVHEVVLDPGSDR